MTRNRSGSVWRLVLVEFAVTLLSGVLGVIFARLFPPDSGYAWCILLGVSGLFLGTITVIILVHFSIDEARRRDRLWGDTLKEKGHELFDRLGTPARIYSTHDGSYYRALEVALRTLTPSDHVHVLAHSREHEPEGTYTTPDNQAARTRYLETLEALVSASAFTYVRIHCLRDYKRDTMTLPTTSIVSWLRPHYDRLLQLRHQTPDHVRFRVTASSVNTDMLVVQGKFAVLLLKKPTEPPNHGTASIQAIWFTENPNRAIIEEIFEIVSAVDRMADNVQTIGDVPSAH